MVDHPDFWSARYKNEQTGWDLGEISTPIKEYADQLIDKSLRILIPGCGRAWEALYLLENGFKNVHVLDFAPEPLEELRNRVGDSSELQMHCVDFFQHTGNYDLVIEQTMFCAIDPAMRDAYVAKVAQLLNPGGKFVGVLFDRSFEGGPPFGGSKVDYEVLFQRYFSSVIIEPCYNSIAPRMGTEVFFIAQKA
jgi:SAM-dependent methyltransferase